MPLWRPGLPTESPSPSSLQKCGSHTNKNKNPIAEKAVRELEEELIRQEPGGRSVSEGRLAIATARLNSRLRFSGLSSRELWTQRNQFTHAQLPFSDSQFILAKHDLRSSNHSFSEKSKNPCGLVPSLPQSKLEILCTSSQTRTSHVLVTATSSSSQTPPGVS